LTVNKGLWRWRNSEKETNLVQYDRDGWTPHKQWRWDNLGHWGHCSFRALMAPAGPLRQCRSVTWVDAAGFGSLISLLHQAFIGSLDTFLVVRTVRTLH
jgi:hypothetical protein